MRPNDSYKRFVDELVDLSRVNVIAKRIREYGHSERDNEREMPLDEMEQRRKSLCLKLSAEDREIVAGMIEDEYASALHDVASFLEFKLSSNNMKILWNGEDVPASPYATMHFDYISRRRGDIWPDEVN